MKNYFKLLLTSAATIGCIFAIGACAPAEDKKTDEVDTSTTYAVNTTISDESLGNLLGSSKLYVTTIGQSDMDSATSILSSIGVETSAYTADNQLQASAVEDNSTVIVVIGTSSKGLGSAGTNEAKELERANAFSAKSSKIKIVALHFGGKPRRGETSDPSIEVIAKASKVMLVVDKGDGNGGNYDGKFTSLSKTNSVPFYTYSKASNMVNSIKFILGK